MKKNLILSIIDNYNYFHVERFFNSLFQTKFDGHICIFSGPNNDPKLVKRLKEMNIEVVFYEPDFPYIDNPHEQSLKYLPTPIHIFNYRHFIYYDYLLKNGHMFNAVLLTDIRDVIFQKNPFGFEIEDTLYVALETQLIKECEWTSGWVLSGYEPEELEKIENNFVTCAGTTMGPVHHVKRYLAIMLTEILTVKDAYKCADQAIQNVLLYNNKLEPTVRLSNEMGIIMTVGTADPVSFVLDKQGYLSNGTGRRANIVHQSDRHRELQLELDKFVFKRSFPLSVLKAIYDRFPFLSNLIKLVRR